MGMKKVLLSQFGKDMVECVVLCPFCGKSNMFGTHKLISGYLMLECSECKGQHITKLKWKMED